METRRTNKPLVRSTAKATPPARAASSDASASAAAGASASGASASAAAGAAASGASATGATSAPVATGAAAIDASSSYDSESSPSDHEDDYRVFADMGLSPTVSADDIRRAVQQAEQEAARKAQKEEAIKKRQRTEVIIPAWIKKARSHRRDDSSID